VNSKDNEGELNTVLIDTCISHKVSSRLHKKVRGDAELLMSTTTSFKGQQF